MPDALNLDTLETLAAPVETEDGFVLRYPPLYKIDSKGKVRVWFVERQSDSHRVVAGILDGSLVAAGWTVCKSKGKGKAQTTPEQQAIQEVRSKYQHELDREYFDSVEGARGPARFFKPMLAEKWGDLGADLQSQWAGAQKRLAGAGFIPTPLNTGVFHEPKLDGFCSITQADRMTSREGQPIVAVPHIREALAGFFAAYPEAVLHGELYNHELRADFEILSSILKKQKDITPEQAQLAREMAQLHVYDYAGPGVRDLPLSARKAALNSVLGPYLEATGGVIQIVQAIPCTDAEHLEALRVQAVDDGFEGQMAKLDLGAYEQKRSWSVLKRKVFDDAEFDVAQIVEGKGNYAGYAKRVTCWRPGADRSAGITKDNTFGAGIKGKRDAKLAALLHEDHKVVTIRYFGLTADGVPRMGVAIKWHGEARTL